MNPMNTYLPKNNIIINTQTEVYYGGSRLVSERSRWGVPAPRGQASIRRVDAGQCLRMRSIEGGYRGGTGRMVYNWVCPAAFYVLARGFELPQCTIRYNVRVMSTSSPFYSSCCRVRCSWQTTALCKQRGDCYTPASGEGTMSPQ